MDSFISGCALMYLSKTKKNIQKDHSLFMGRSLYSVSLWELVCVPIDSNADHLEVFLVK